MVKGADVVLNSALKDVRNSDVPASAEDWNGGGYAGCLELNSYRAFQDTSCNISRLFQRKGDWTEGIRLVKPLSVL